jgi:hypothetical protein
MTDAAADAGPIRWLAEWDEALAAARSMRRAVLIDVWKDP